MSPDRAESDFLANLCSFNLRLFLLKFELSRGFDSLPGQLSHLTFHSWPSKDRVTIGHCAPHVTTFLRVNSYDQSISAISSLKLQNDILGILVLKITTIYFIHVKGIYRRINSVTRVFQLIPIMLIILTARDETLVN